jgi:hypothetical protein
VVADHCVRSNLPPSQLHPLRANATAYQSCRGGSGHENRAFNESMVVTGDLKWSHVRSESKKADNLKETSCALLIVDLQPSVR